MENKYLVCVSSYEDGYIKSFNEGEIYKITGQDTDCYEIRLDEHNRRYPIYDDEFHNFEETTIVQLITHELFTKVIIEVDFTTGNHIFYKDEVYEVDQVFMRSLFLKRCDDKDEVIIFLDVDYCDNLILVNENLPLEQEKKDLEELTSEFEKVNEYLDELLSKPTVTVADDVDYKDISDKLPLQEIRPIALQSLGEIMKYGIDKYGIENRASYMHGEIETYIGAMLRHLIAYQRGEIIDPESNYSHLKHLFMNAYILICLEERDNDNT